MLSIMLVLTFSACVSHTQLASLTPPPLLNTASVVVIEDLDVLEVSPEMDAFLERYILPYKDSQTRLYLLSSAVTSSGMLGYNYDSARTLTAAEAFEKRSGNCVSFANMMIALARRAGLKATYQEVFRTPQWSTRDDTLLLIKHVNVIIESRRYTYVLDASNIEINPMARKRVVEDNYARAMYLNNLGAEALIQNDLPTAYAYMSRAISIEPKMSDSWVNLGVVYGRNEQLDDSKTAFNRALQIDPVQYSAMSNLYEVHLEEGNQEAAQELQARVEKYRRNNPYYLLYLSEEALAMEQYDESLKLLQRALKKQDKDHLLHFALARTQYLSGEKAAAETSLVRARQLAPNNKLAYYDRPLNELIADYQAQLIR